MMNLLKFSCGLLPINSLTIHLLVAYRLAGGEKPTEGRAEHRVAGVWGSICDADFGSGGWAVVFCRTIGFPGLENVVYANTTVIGVGTRNITMHNPGCPLSMSSNMADCIRKNADLCTHQQDVVITCKGTGCFIFFCKFISDAIFSMGFVSEVKIYCSRCMKVIDFIENCTTFKIISITTVDLVGLHGPATLNRSL